MDASINIGNKVKTARMKIGFTQEEFGRIFFVSSKTVMRWEQGKILPTQDQFEIIKFIDKVSKLKKKEDWKNLFVFGGPLKVLYFVLQQHFSGEKHVHKNRKYLDKS